MTVQVNKEISLLFPELVVGVLEGPVNNSEDNRELWEMIGRVTGQIKSTMDAEAIRQVDGIRLGKQAYRQLGKDPNRYRLSAEALMRRIVKGQDLYAINTVVDVLNLVSLQSGITIGGFDRALVDGSVELGIGWAGEAFEAIGRGPLNVEDLPVYRDRSGAIGNPTSDCMRTRITLSTSTVLMLITGFYGPGGISEVLESLEGLLGRFCQGGPFSKDILSA
ncbi:MAG: phenylalanine--tRNA ligase beta subunit-related protein [Bacteroidales bacterium]